MLAVQEPGRVASGVMAVTVHVVFLGLLVFGISWQKKIAIPVEVELWEDLPETLVSPPRRPPAPPKPDPPKPVAVVKKLPPPAPPKAVVPAQLSEAEIELREKKQRQKEEEARKIEEQKLAEAEKRRLEEEKRQDQDEARRRADAEVEQLKKERELAERKQLEEQRRADELKREQERKDRVAAMERDRQQRDNLRKQREAEEASQRAQAAVRTAHDLKIAEFRDKIMMKIRSRVVMPPNIEGNPEARFEVVLLPGGELLERAKLTRSSGIPAYDTAVERAIHAAQPLPVPPETELFQESFRELSLVFRPKD